MRKRKCIGVKIVEAESMTKHGFLNSVKNEDISSNVENRPGYKVTYKDGYVSWSPKEVFDKAYRSISEMNFGFAVEALKKGYRVLRKDWIGKHKWLQYRKMETRKENIVSPFIELNKTSDFVVPYTPTQDDILAEDWMIFAEDDGFYKEGK